MLFFQAGETPPETWMLPEGGAAHYEGTATTNEMSTVHDHGAELGFVCHERIFPCKSKFLFDFLLSLFFSKRIFFVPFTPHPTSLNLTVNL